MLKNFAQPLRHGRGSVTAGVPILSRARQQAVLQVFRHAFKRFYIPVFLCILIACQRERRALRPSPATAAVYGDVAPQSELHPGRETFQRVAMNRYEQNAFAISEGKRLFDWYNCSGCHFNGGGGIGPPLIKTVWTYGNEPENLFDTIVKGRPNGMPSWGGRIPEYQIWQLVTYVRSLNHDEPSSATPARPDTIEPDGSTIRPAGAAK
jgi:cytochrome c oxidase cbb3-type subunit 3